MPRPMKWHIFDAEDHPLCWNDEAIEFDTEEQAIRFLKSHTDAVDVDYDEYCQAFGVDIRECIFYYDGGHLDCSNKIVYIDDEGEDHLVDAE